MNYSREGGGGVRDHLREMPSILVSPAESHLSCGQQRGFFAWQWKFMVALLCPNNSHIVSRTDSPCRKQQACYQSHLCILCNGSPKTPPKQPPPPLFLPPIALPDKKQKTFGGKATDSIHQIQGEFYPRFWMGEATIKIRAVPESKWSLLYRSPFAKTWKSFGE